MESRTLEINVMSAKDLQKVNLISKMDVYVVAYIEGAGDRSKQKKKTPVNRDGGANPSWNCPMKFTLDETAARQNRLTIVFQLRCERALGDRDIGEVHVPVKELLDSPAGADGKVQFVNYQVMKPSGKPKGQLSFSYKLGEKIAGAPVSKADEPAMAYPAGPSSAYPPPSSYPPPSAAAPAAAYPPPKYESPYPATGYPPQGAPPATAYPPQPQAAFGYAGYPPQPAYGGYPPQQAPGAYGYPPPGAPAYGGYPPQVVQPGKAPKKNKFGMGLGAGLLGGALGGLLIGDMVSDASSYDAGYDQGFDDGGFDGGFDF